MSCVEVAETSPAPAFSTAATIWLGGSEGFMLHPFTINATEEAKRQLTSARSITNAKSVPTWPERLSITNGWNIIEIPFRSRFSGRLVLDDSSLVGLFARHVRNHQLAKFLQPLDLLL